MKIADPNHGYSLGLDHQYVFGRVCDRWMVWHRRDGEVVDVIPRRHDESLQRYEAEKACYRWCGVSMWPSQEVINEMDSTP